MAAVRRGTRPTVPSIARVGDVESTLSPVRADAAVRRGTRPTMPCGAEPDVRVAYAGGRFLIRRRLTDRADLYSDGLTHA
jgi:hypothetical protein